MFAPFSRIALFLVAVCGWALLFFGATIASRGVLFYDWDAVLMGTGGGIALGGLMVVALTIGAQAQVSTARDTAALLRLTEMRRAPMPGPEPRKAIPTEPTEVPRLRTVKATRPDGKRAEPTLKR